MSRAATLNAATTFTRAPAIRSHLGCGNLSDGLIFDAGRIRLSI